jgi:hypothetical protein
MKDDKEIKLLNELPLLTEVEIKALLNILKRKK